MLCINVMTVSNPLPFCNVINHFIMCNLEIRLDKQVYYFPYLVTKKYWNIGQEKTLAISDYWTKYQHLIHQICNWMYMSFFASCFSCTMALLQYFKRADKPKVTLLSKLISLSECQLQQVNNHLQKTMGDNAITSGNGKKWCHQNIDYWVKERVDIGKINIPQRMVRQKPVGISQTARKTFTRIHSKATCAH